jgi:ATP-dependent exoDNAse (exonuclease V) beta subunit
LTLADLFALAGDDHAATIWSLMNDAERLVRLSADGQQRLGHLRTVMAEALAGQGRQRRRIWVEDAWKKLGGPQCLAHAGEQLDVQAFFKRLDALDAAGRFAIDTLEDDMAGLFAVPDAQADGRLQLMTIHKSKGLEFDTVILPGLHRKTSGNDVPLLAWDSISLPEGERLLAAPVNPRRAGEAAPSLYDFLQKLENQRKENEEARVLYVAATRAIRCVHLVGAVSRKESADGTEIAPPSATSPLGRLWPVLEAAFAEAGQGTQGKTETAVFDSPLAEFVPQLVRQQKPQVSAAWQAPTLSIDSAYREEPATNALAAALGTLTHACLEQIAGHVEDWDAARLANLQPAAERWLASRGWPQAESASGAARVIGILRTALNSADGQWVLRAREGAVAELALSKVGAGGTAMNTLETRVVDRSFIDNGARWIIDYKTADLGAHASEAELATHAGRFRAQLQAYAILFADESLPQRLAIFYVAHGKLITITN